MNVLDLFAGCGGMSEGFRQAGYNIVGFVEFWKDAKDTFMLNFPEIVFFGDDIRKISDFEVKKLKGKIDVIIGGPPCQGFSMAGKRDVKDPRNSLFMEYIRFVRLIRPKVFVMENVYGIYTMLNAKGESVFNIIMKEFENIGYNILAKVLSADNYGVAQKRKRVIFIGVVGSIDIKKMFPKSVSEKKTVMDVIGDLPYGEIKELQHVFRKKKVERKLISMIEGQKLSSFGSAGKKLYWDRPSCTITKSAIYGHPKYNRYLSVRECARLQSFPDSFKFCGGLESVYGQIGNAVPVLMAKVIGESIKKGLSEKYGKKGKEGA